MTRHFGGLHSSRQSDKARLFILLGVGIVVVFFVVALLSFLSTPTAAPAKAAAVETHQDTTVKMVEVLVPIQNIEAGTPLEANFFRKESRPQVGVSPRVVRDFEEIQGQYARSLILPGQPLHRDYITSVRPTNAITANIPENHRAVTISVDARSSVEGWARPGARVDVVWASNIRGAPGLTTIVQNARILSAERQTEAKTNPGQPVPSTVTLLVSVQDAAKIQLAQTTGTLSLQLRGDNDPGKGQAGGSITVADLLGNSTQGPANECEGTVTMGGIKYCVKPGGRLEPAE
ncbi:MAG: Flp pilus assembly protein CpaB [Proteobacteria bacterium]|nr:MAG: Flp pilus assembly protein CpaB [Pseudomonadota bacterium]